MPYSFSWDDTSKDATGLDVEILKSVMEAAGCQFFFSVSEVPWKRQLIQIKDGELDLVFGVSKNAQREAYGRFTDQYRTRSVGLFVRRGQVKKWQNIATIEDLANTEISIGVVRGYSYGSSIDKILKTMGQKIYFVGKPKQMRLMLTKRRIDGYLAYLPDETILLNDIDLDHKIRIHPMKTVYSGGIHFLLSKKSTSSVTTEMINNALRSIKSNGQYDKITNKYKMLYGINQW